MAELTPHPSQGLTSGDQALRTDARRICRDLIQIDTSNLGDESGPGERLAAELVMRELAEVGLGPTLLESRPRRANVLLRINGTDPTRPGLAIHGHLDTVPAVAADWKVPPWAAEVMDDCIWGRGAVDMKAMNAMVIATLRRLVAQGWQPRRDIVVAFFADEEALSALGSHWVVDNYPEYFEGVTEAITEVGGFSVTLPSETGPKRVYLLQTAEKGTLWLRLSATGRAGHGSVHNPEGAILRLVQALGRVTAHEWPLELIASTRSLLHGLAELVLSPGPDRSSDTLLELLGHTHALIDASLQDTVNVTRISGGYLTNVVPQRAEAWLDCRFLPGHEEWLLRTITELVGDHVQVHVEDRDVAIEAPQSAPLFEQMSQSLRVQDPEARVLPYCLAAGTDNKALSRLGIRGYGFTPLKLPADLDFASLFHGVDERVPLESIDFGARTMHHFLERC